MTHALTPVRKDLCAWLRGTGLTLALSAGLYGSLHGAAMAGPANLLIQWRISDSAHSQGTEAQVGGGGWSVSTRQAQSQQGRTQSVMVLNGGRAKLYFGQTVAHTSWQVLLSAKPGQGDAQAQLIPQTQWIDLGQGMQVRPRWKGGSAPVELDIEAQSRTPVGAVGLAQRLAPDGQTQRQELSTTVSVPMGQWVVMARSQSQASQGQQGVGRRHTWSTGEIEQQQGDQIEVRVSLP